VLGAGIRIGFLPFNIILDYNNKKLLYFLALQGFGVGMVLLFVCKHLVKDKLFKFGILMVFLPLIPVMNIYPLENFFATRYVYLSCFGFSILLSTILNINKKLTALSFVIVTLFLSCVTITGQTYFLSKERFAKKMIADNEESYKALNYLGTINIDKREIDKAQEYYEKALSINPDYLEACYNLASVYIKHGFFDEAEKVVQNIIKLNPYRSDGYRLWGDILLKKSNLEKAIQLYEKALFHNYFDLDARNNLGTVYEQLNNLDKAADLYLVIISINPIMDLAWSNLGNINIKRSEYDLAVQCYLEALQINDANAQTWYNLGNAYFYKRQWSQAEECYTQALLYNPSFHEALYNLSVTQLNSGDRNSAIKTLDRYLEINPDDLSARQQLELLKAR